jgi:hypothetical protein
VEAHQQAARAEKKAKLSNHQEQWRHHLPNQDFGSSRWTCSKSLPCLPSVLAIKANAGIPDQEEAERDGHARNYLLGTSGAPKAFYVQSDSARGLKDRHKNEGHNDEQRYRHEIRP